MDSLTARDFTHSNGETTHYYEGGSQNGTPLIFIHGWPDIAESWVHQLTHFSSKGNYRVIAPDMRGYGNSTSPKDKRAYSLETLTNELVELAAHLNIKKAVWIGHDWGSGVLSALAAHHPDLFLGLILLSVPYRTIELGLNHLVTLVNRDIYPKEDYEFGPWEYMRYYELSSQDSIKAFDENIERITKIFYLPHDPSNYGKPSATSRVIREGGWFGGRFKDLPDIPLSSTFLSESHYNNLLASHKKHGFFPPTAYYLNHDVNAEFAKKEANGGKLEFPVLFIDAKHDAVCSTSTAPLMGKGQKERCEDLTERTVEAAHWVMLEKGEEVNGIIGGWLGEKI